MSARLCCALFLALSFLAVAPARGASAGAALTGSLTNNGVPVSGVVVTASGNNAVFRAKTDASGKFAFPELALGTYSVRASAQGRSAQVNVDLGSSGATISLSLGLVEIGKVAVVRTAPVRGSGADVTLNSTILTRSPTSDSFPETLIQLPGTARGANGVVHMNGDHGVIDYVIDGVPIPQALNREIGSEIDPNDISFLDVMEGAYPAQYGLRFGSVLNITTRAGTGPAGFDGNVQFGSYTDIDQTLGYHTPLAGGGGLDVAVRNQQSTRALDPPDFGSPHNNGSDTNQFARLALANGGGNFTDITLIHSFRTFQIPNDVSYGEPAIDRRQRVPRRYVSQRAVPPSARIDRRAQLRPGASRSRTSGTTAIRRTTSSTAKRSTLSPGPLGTAVRRPTARKRSRPETSPPRLARSRSTTIRRRLTIFSRAISCSASASTNFAAASRTT